MKNLFQIEKKNLELQNQNQMDWPEEINWNFESIFPDNHQDRTAESMTIWN